MSSITKRLLMASAVAAALAVPTIASAQWGGYPGNWGGPGWGGPGCGNNWGGMGWDDAYGYGRGYGSGRGYGRGTGRGHFGFNMDTDMNGWTDDFFGGNGWGNNGWNNGWGNNGWGNNGWGPWRRGWW